MSTTPANSNPLAARSQQDYRTIEPASYPIKADADTIDDILSCFLIYILPATFFSAIIVLGTMLISYTIVMGIPLPRLFALIIVIVFAGLITVTFFLLMVFHFRRRCQRRIRRFQKVRFTLSETSSIAGRKGVVPGTGGARSLISHVSSRSAEISRISLLNVTEAVAAVAAVGRPPKSSELTVFVAQEQDIPIPAIPLLRKVKCYANIKQAAQNQDQDSHNKALVTPAQESTTSPLPHDSAARVLPSSSSIQSSLPENQWPLRPSPLRRPPPLITSPATAAGHARPKEAAIYYLPPGPPNPVPIPSSAGIRPIWADDIERQINANQQASSETPGRHRLKWWPK